MRRGDDKADFAFGWSCGEVVDKFLCGAQAVFLVAFGEFAGHAERSVRGEGFDGFQGFEDAVRGFMEDSWGRGFQCLFEGFGTASGFVGEESAECECFRGEARSHKSRGGGARSRQDGDRKPFRAAGPDESGAWIGDARHAGICHQSDMQALRDAGDELRGARGFIMLVKADKRFGDFEVMEEHARVAGILCRDQIACPQSLQCPQGNIPQIANRRGDNAQHLYQPSEISVDN
jgi:hypothetical protein